MYSQGIFSSAKIIEEICLVGITDVELDLLKHYSTFEKEKSKPEILYAIPNNKPAAMQATLDFAFPRGMEISLFEEKPKIYSIALTNEKGIRSYLYILLFYDKYRINEEDLDLEIGKSSITSMSSLSRTLYCPVAICISSYWNNISFFRNLLNEYYRIISFNSELLKKNNNSTSNTESQIVNYQKVELMNYLLFSFEMLKPPPKAKLNLGLRFNTLEFWSQSKLEIPSNDFNIEVLFNCLEISSIIKLFLALLFEKHIILIGNQNMTLFSICEALISLIFPFKWVHSYIPILPFDQMGYLESPPPYIMGIHSSFSDVQELTELYPTHIICDIGTSQVYGTNPTNLPSNEEAKIRTKLLLLKNRKKNNYDDIDIEHINVDDEEIEDVSSSHSFAENVHSIFFRLFRTYLTNIKEKFISNNVFNSQKFLNSFDSKEHRIFFEKLINTLGFEYFFLSMQYLDDSNSRQFNYICHNKKALIEKQKYYEYDFSVYHHSLMFNNPNMDSSDEYKRDYIEVITELEKAKADNTNSSNNNNSTIKNNNGSFGSLMNTQLSFYQKNGFLHFVNSYHGLKNPSIEIQNEIRTIAKDIKEGTFKINKNFTFKSIHIPNNDSSQFYLVIATYLSYYCFPEYSKMIFDLFGRSLTKNPLEFPRNFFYMLLSKYTHHELKQMAISPLKYISKSVLCYLRKIEKVKLKTMVISHDSDDSSYENEIDLDKDNGKGQGNNGLIEDSDPLMDSSLRQSQYHTNTFNNGNNQIGFKPKMSTRALIHTPLMNTINSTTKNQKRLMKKNTVKISLYKLDDKDNHSMADLKKLKLNSVDPNMKINSIEKDPIALAENICVSLFSLLTSTKIENLNNAITDSNYLRELAKSDRFIEVKNMILSLQKISLLKISQNATSYFCFWLNLYNFLTIFSIIYKCEMMTNYYEWYRFLKNSYFTIGNCEISLYEIENVILRSDEVSKRIYGESVKNEIQNLPKLDYFDSIINFGISIPAISSPALRIYFPYNFLPSLRLNCIEFFARTLSIDLTTLKITLPEYLLFIEPNFLERIKLYHHMLPSEIINYVSDSLQLVKCIEKFNWKINFENFRNVEAIG